MFLHHSLAMLSLSLVFTSVKVDGQFRILEIPKSSTNPSWEKLVGRKEPYSIVEFEKKTSTTTVFVGQVCCLAPDTKS